MCFYDQKVFICGDFKWTRFRQKCVAEHRTGETCGLKLVMSTVKVNKKCVYCERLQKKISRLWKEEQRIMRWKTSNELLGNPTGDISRSRTASIDTSKRILEDLRRDILKLQEEREFPFASLDFERWPNSEGGNKGGDVINGNLWNNVLPSLKLSVLSNNSLPKLVAQDDPLSSESNMLLLRLLETETSSAIQLQRIGSKDADAMPIDGQGEERLALILTLRLLHIAFESLILPDGTVHLRSGTSFSTTPCPGITPRIFGYIHCLKIDILHSGLSSQLIEAVTEIKCWLPRLTKALTNSNDDVKDAPRQLQRLLSTLRGIKSRIRHSGFRRMRHVPLTIEQQWSILSESNKSSTKKPQLEDRLLKVKTPSLQNASKSHVSGLAG